MPYVGKSPSAVGVRSRYYFTASGGETSLSGSDNNGKTLVFTDAAYVDVILNGNNLVSGTDYVAVPNTNTISGLAALVANDVVEIISYDVFSVSDTVPASTGGTFSGGLTVPSLTTTGDISFGDNDKAIFGAGSDLQIFHDGSNSWINEVGTGQLILAGEDVRITTPNAGEFMATFGVNGAATLYYDNAAKIATTATGVDVTGTVTADGLTVDGSSTLQNVTVGVDGTYGGNYRTLGFSGNTNGSTRIFGTTDDSDNLYLAAGTGRGINFWVNGSSSTVMQVNSSGNVGIGASTIAANTKLHVKAGTNLNFEVENSSSTLRLSALNDARSVNIPMQFASSQFEFITGNVGIGTSSPVAQSKLTVAGNSLSITGSDANFGAGGVRGMLDLASGYLRMGAVNGGGSASGVKLIAPTGQEALIVDTAARVGINGIPVNTGASLPIVDLHGGQGDNGILIRTGDNNVGSGGGSVMQFGFNTSTGYRHAIKTRHDSAINVNNAIEFYTWQTSQNSADLGNLKVLSAGAVGVTMPNQPAFAATTNSSTAVGNYVNFGATHFNTGGHFNTSNGRFTAPCNGRYWFYWHLLTDRTTSTGEGYIDLYKNASYWYRNYETKGSTANQHVEYKGGLTIEMTANDYVVLYFGVTIGGNIIASTQHCTFGGFLIG